MVEFCLSEIIFRETAFHLSRIRCKRYSLKIYIVTKKSSHYWHSILETSPFVKMPTLCFQIYVISGAKFSTTNHHIFRQFMDFSAVLIYVFGDLSGFILLAHNSSYPTSSADWKSHKIKLKPNGFQLTGRCWYWTTEKPWSLFIYVFKLIPLEWLWLSKRSVATFVYLLVSYMNTLRTLLLQSTLYSVEVTSTINKLERKMVKIESI